MGWARVVEEAELGAIGEQGEAADRVIGSLAELKRRNVPTYGPRMFRPSYFAGEDVVRVAEEAFRHFIKENWLYGRTSYPAVGMFEDEVLASVLDLFHAPREAGGVLTSGGTESLILSVKVARDHAREAGRASPLNIVIPHTGHPAFEKAGDLLEVEVRRAPSSVDWGADVEWMRQACDARTALLVGSAPPYPFGQVDPITDLAALAAEKDIWLHVDACLGGMVLPFVSAAGKTAPPFDFRIPDVRSISVDLHKFGYAVKGISALLLRDRASGVHARTVFDNWPAGLYATPGISGSRSAGALASAWAVMRYLGHAGFAERTRRILANRDAFISRLESCGAQTLGRPDTFHFNFTIPGVDSLVLAEAMTEEGWVLSSTENPASLQLMITAAHDGVAETFAADVQRLSSEIASRTRKGSGKGAVYSKVILGSDIARLRGLV
jgi:glutamate/tyrosine decarboxylase-like PLP-dependent enzyme